MIHRATYNIKEMFHVKHYKGVALWIFFCIAYMRFSWAGLSAL